MVAEDDDLGIRVEPSGAGRDLAHRDEDGALDPRDRVLRRFPDVEENDAGPSAPGRGLGRADRRSAQKPSSTLVTSDWAKRSASASIATFSRSE